MNRYTLFVSLLLMSAPALAQTGEGRFSGLGYSDYYWAASHHNSSIEGQNGFWFRRIYLTYTHDYASAFEARIRFEMNSAGDFVSDSEMRPYVKDAWLKWKTGRHEALAGISPSPAFSRVEEFWGYRAVEKTPLDLQRMADSRGFGLAAKGYLDHNQRFGYHAMISNGTGIGPEISRGKKYQLALSWAFTDRWIMEVYGDRNRMDERETRSTLQGFAGYETDTLAFGFLYAWQHRETPMENLGLRIASLFIRSRIGSGTSLFFRADHLFDPNPEGEQIDYLPFHDETTSTLLLTGIDFQLLKDSVSLIPNIETVFYGEVPGGERPVSDVIPRLTLYFNF